MKVLFLNQFFWPDSSATSQLLTDLARGMVDRGHEVTVICAAGGYAPSATGEQLPGVRIERVNALPFVRGKAGRLLSYLSFYLFALVRAVRLPKADLVVSLTTPPLISLIGSLLRTVRGSRHVIWEMDVYPDVAVELNYFASGGLVHRVTGMLADVSRRRTDAILALGECMKQRLAARGVPAEKIFVAENWADGNAIRPHPRTGAPGELVLLYSGNLGLAHDLDTLTGAIDLLRDDTRFRFVFVGGGGRRQQLADFCVAEKIHSVQMLPYAAREDLGQSLSAGDIGLVTQLDASCGTVVPSKVYGILAAGRPILFIGPRNSTPAYTVARFGCGWQVDCGDVDSLTALLRHLVDHPGEVASAGERARTALLQHFDLPIGVERIARFLESAVSHPAPETSLSAFPEPPTSRSTLKA